MHLILLLSLLLLAWILRCSWYQRENSWRDRWHWALGLFLVPPMLLVTGAIAVLWMGPYGEMVWSWEGWMSYGIALSFLSFALFTGLRAFREGCQVISRVRNFPKITQNGRILRVLDLSLPYSAQIGFWNPELVVSQGMLKTLEAEYLEAVLIHEQAHYHYRDTFWFFWLGWLRQITFWLPQTEALWQELLMLRELRADHWATQKIDALLLAEALLTVVQRVSIFPDSVCAAFGENISASRLTQRIEALLTEGEQIEQHPLWTWTWLCVALLPLMVIPLHY
jgi:Zn-dependent protease with chaperone function